MEYLGRKRTSHAPAVRSRGQVPQTIIHARVPLELSECMTRQPMIPMHPGGCAGLRTSCVPHSLQDSDD